jgi:hypothetical protein
MSEFTLTRYDNVAENELSVPANTPMIQASHNQRRNEQLVRMN